MDEQKDEELQEDISEIEQSGTSEEIVEETEHSAVEQPSEVEETPVEETVEEVVEEAAPVEQAELPQKLVEQPKQVGAPVPGKIERLKAFIGECKRVLRVTKKPDKQEFYTIVKISSIGMGIIGIIGFLIHFAKELLF